MNNRLFFVVFFSLIIINSGCGLVKKNDCLRLPQPTEIADYAGSTDEQKQRQAWIEAMHRIEEGKSWRKQDMQSRLERQAVRSANHPADIPGTWHERGSKNQSGRVHVAEYLNSSNSLYIATSGGNIWKGNLSGTSWTPLNDHFRIPGISMLRIIKAGTQTRILAASNAVGAFYYSDDNGLTWNQSNGLENILSWGAIRRAVVVSHPENTIYVLSLEWDYTNWNSVSCIYKSTNQGQSFTKLLEFPEPVYGSAENFDIWTDPHTESDVYVVENENVYIVDNNMLAPVGVLPPIPDGSKLKLTGVQKASDTYLYVLANKDNQTNFYRSTNAGTTWTAAAGSVPESPFQFNSFACSVENPENVYFGGVNCYRSSNSGDSWEKVNEWFDYYSDPANKLHADIPGINIFSVDGQEKVLISTDGGIYISDDDLQTVNNISLSNLNISQYYSTHTCYFNNAEVIHAGSQDQGYQKTSSSSVAGVLSFEQVTSGDFGHLFSSDNGQAIWMVYPGVVYCYPEIMYNTYLAYWTFGSNITGQLWLPPIIGDPQNPDVAYLAGGHPASSSGAYIYTLTRYGYNLTHTVGSYNFADEANENISAMEYSAINNDYRYVLTNNGDFYTSTNNGQNWTESQGVSGPPAHFFYGADILASKTTLGRIYICGSGYSNPPVYLSTDNGTTFTDISNGLPNTMVYALAANADESRIYAATELGPYMYVVAENQWYDLYNGVAPDQVYWAVEFVEEENTARFATYGRGIWDFQEDFTTSVSTDEQHTTVVYPNPVKDVLHLELTNHTVAKLTISDASGKTIIEITEVQPAETINLSGLSSGIYFVRIETETGIITEKIVKE